jgi:hypothetical protein
MLKQQFERLEEFFNDIFEGALTFTTQKPAKAINTDIILEWGDILSWGIFALLLIFFVFIIIRHYRIIEFLTKHLLIWTLVVWFIGIVVYMVGFYHPAVNGLSVVPRAIISSFKMFVVANELARVEEPLRYSASYMVAFSLTHLAAAFISFLFIFKMIGYKLHSETRILWYKLFKSQGKIVHIFWGINEPSLALAKSIRREFSGDTIIFIDVDKESGDQTKQKATLSMITNAITIDNNEIATLESINAFVDHCYNGPSELKGSNDIFGELGLNSIGSIVSKSAKARFYLLSDNEVQNIQGALNIENDKTVAAKADSIEIYVHARKDVNNEIFDHYSQYETKGLCAKIKVIDSAFLSIAQLKRDHNALPVNCVAIDKSTGCVNEPFSALIAGFGATGLEAFKFLYEYATFINSDLDKTPFRCYAIDQNMEQIAGLISRKMPALAREELTLINAAVNSEKFWESIKGIIDKLNYIFVTLNDDHTSLALAVNLFKWALQHRSKSLPMLKIMLRCYNGSSEQHMVEVVEKLNESVAGRNVEICIFGSIGDIYTYETVLSGKVLGMAKEFNRVYKGSTNDADTQWRIDFGNDNIEKLMATKCISRYHAIAEINRQIGQNFANALHAKTKMLLMGFDSDDMTDDLQRYYGFVEHHNGGVDSYNCDAQAATLLRNIAILEHERWVSAHKLIGYTLGEKDYEKKNHPNIRPWKELDEKTQSYDFKVVDTTIKIAYAEAKRRENN